MSKKVDKTFISAEKAAERLGVSKTMIYKLVSLKEIPNYKFGTRIMFESSELSAWIASKKAV